MKNIIAIIAIALFVSSCVGNKEKGDIAGIFSDKTTKQINNHLNIIITPDLSNRISVHTRHKAVHDTLLIKALLNSYYPDIYKSNGRVTGQKDEISFLFTNSTIISQQNINMDALNIDFSNFSDGQRIQYLVSHSDEIALYELDKKKMNNEVKRIYNNLTENPGGADILNYFNQQLKKPKIKENSKPFKFDQTIVYNNQRNILILFTDGYIEAGLYGNINCTDNQCVYLDESVINKFRNSFKASNESDIKKFFVENNYGIKPIENEQLKDLEVIVVEMYDRSLANSGSQRQVPNDLEIIKIFWSDWLEKSGVKKYKLFGTANSEKDFTENINSLIEVK